MASSAGAASPTVATFDDFVVEACAALAAMEDAVGNPETGERSAQTEELQAALEAEDHNAAVQAGAAIDEKLRVAREHAAAAARWEPGAGMMQAFDRLMAAFQTQAAADVKRGNADPDATQRSFEEAGGVDAWTDMWEASQRVMTARPAGTPPRTCRGGLGASF